MRLPFYFFWSRPMRPDNERGFAPSRESDLRFFPNIDHRISRIHFIRYGNEHQGIFAAEAIIFRHDTAPFSRCKWARH